MGGGRLVGWLVWFVGCLWKYGMRERTDERSKKKKRGNKRESIITNFSYSGWIICHAIVTLPRSHERECHRQIQFYILFFFFFSILTCPRYESSHPLASSFFYSSVVVFTWHGSSFSPSFIHRTSSYSFVAIPLVLHLLFSVTSFPFLFSVTFVVLLAENE